MSESDKRQRERERQRELDKDREREREGGPLPSRTAAEETSRAGKGGGVEPVSPPSAAAAMLLSAACLGASRSSAGVACRRCIPESQVSGPAWTGSALS